MTTSNSNNSTIDQLETDSHVLLTNMHATPFHCKSLKLATDKAEELIKADNSCVCYIYQLRTVMKGEIQFTRKDFSN